MHAVISPESHIQTANQIFDGVFDQSLDFRVEMPYDAAMHFLRRIGSYNNFQAEKVIEAMRRVDALIPRRIYNEGNLNNGERRYDISVGREGSPVIYLDYFEWVDSERLTEADMKAIRGVLERDGMADESSFEIDDHGIRTRRVTFRFWWD